MVSFDLNSIKIEEFSKEHATATILGIIAISAVIWWMRIQNKFPKLSLNKFKTN